MDDVETKRRALKGEWWIPGKLDRKVGGVLRFHPRKGLALELFGSLGVEWSSEILPIIVGHTSDVGAVTLTGCQLGTQPHILFGDGTDWVRETWQADAALLGSAFAEARDLEFRVAQVSLTCLPQFLVTSGFRARADLDRPLLVHEFPDELRGEGVAGTIYISRSVHSGGRGPFERTFREVPAIAVEAPSALALEEWHGRYLWPLRNFMTLATTMPSRVTKVAFARNEAPPHDCRVELLQRYSGKGPTKCHSGFSGDMLFSLHDVGERFPALLMKWFAVSRELQTACDVYFSLRYQRDTYVEQQFRSLFYALESYHHRRFPSKRGKDSEDKDRAASILQCIPADHPYRSWLERRLSRQSGTPLRERFVDLLEMCGAPVAAFVKDRDRFVRVVLDTRHFLTHLNPENELKAVSGIELYEYCRVLDWMMQVCLLKELGFGDDEVETFVQRNQAYKFESRKIRLPQKREPCSLPPT